MKSVQAMVNHCSSGHGYLLRLSRPSLMTGQIAHIDSCCGSTFVICGLSHVCLLWFSYVLLLTMVSNWFVFKVKSVQVMISICCSQNILSEFRIKS